MNSPKRHDQSLHIKMKLQYPLEPFKRSIGPPRSSKNSLAAIYRARDKLSGGRHSSADTASSFCNLAALNLAVISILLCSFETLKSILIWDITLIILILYKQKFGCLEGWINDCAKMQFRPAIKQAFYPINQFSWNINYFETFRTTTKQRVRVEASLYVYMIKNCLNIYFL